MPTAYLPPTLLSGLSDVSVSPGTAIAGYPLWWNNTLSKWVGGLPPFLATGSFSVTPGPGLTYLRDSGQIVLEAGVGNPIGANIFLWAGESAGTVYLRSGILAQLPANRSNPTQGFTLSKGAGFIQFVNYFAGPDQFSPSFQAKNQNSQFPSLFFIAQQSELGDNQYGVLAFRASNSNQNGRIADGHTAITFANFDFLCLVFNGAGEANFRATTESTSTTTGSVRIDGGLGVAKNTNIGGDLKCVSGVNFADLPTASTGLNSGDLWRDSNGFLRIV